MPSSQTAIAVRLRRGNVYAQKEPKALVRIVGQAPLAATLYELEKLRCNACGQMFTAEEPEGVGPQKYDETASAMVAQLKYGSGMPFHHVEKMEQLLGIPMPASTQWKVVQEAAELIQPVQEELIRQAAQDEVLHNDDTSMRVLRLEREPADDRTGVFTSGIVSTAPGRKLALYFTGRQHAGENLAPRRPRPSRCAMRFRATIRSFPQASSCCWRTAWRTDGASSWKGRRTFPMNAAMCSSRWAACMVTMRRRASCRCDRKNGCASIRSTTVR